RPGGVVEVLIVAAGPEGPHRAGRVDAIPPAGPRLDGLIDRGRSIAVIGGLFGLELGHKALVVVELFFSRHDKNLLENRNQAAPCWRLPVTLNCSKETLQLLQSDLRLDALGQ